jgi:DNA-binding response OmpR family regulator
VIEDDEALSSLVRDYLTAEGFDSDAVTDGNEGLARALGKNYDLILLDLMLPSLGGFEILKKVRLEKDTPVLLVSARSGDIDKIRGLGLGADDYVSKPFSPSELMARVKAHLARYRKLTGRETPAANLLVLGPITVDAVKKIVRINERETEFTAKEFELLHLLVSNPDRLFPKEELYARVWGEDMVGDQSTVTVHVRKIREKIEVDPSEPKFLQTVWGLGYRMRFRP